MYKILFSDKNFIGNGIQVIIQQITTQKKGKNIKHYHCWYKYSLFFGAGYVDYFKIILNNNYKTNLETCLKVLKSNTLIKLLMLHKNTQYHYDKDFNFDELNFKSLQTLEIKQSGKTRHYPIDLNMIDFIKDYRRYSKLNRKLEILNKKLFPKPKPTIKEDVLKRLKWIDDEVEKERNSVKGFTIHYYRKVLGVSRVSSKKEIKRQYRMLSLKFHPDKNPAYENMNELTDVYIEINTAYDILKQFLN